MEIKTQWDLVNELQNVYTSQELDEFGIEEVENRKYLHVDDLIKYLEKFVEEYPSQKHLVKTLLNELKKE